MKDHLETFLAETKAKSENGEGVTTNRRGMNPAATMSGFVSYTMPYKP